MISAVSLHWVEFVWLLMMRNDSWTMIVEQDLQHRACNLSTWGGSKTPTVFAGRLNVCLAWSPCSCFS